MAAPIVPPDDGVARRHAFVGSDGVPTLIGREDEKLTRRQAIDRLRAMHNRGLLPEQEVRLLDYDDDGGGRALGKVDTRFPATTSREIGRAVARLAGYSDGEPPEAA